MKLCVPACVAAERPSIQSHIVGVVCLHACVTEESRGPLDSASSTLIKLSQSYLKKQRSEMFMVFRGIF